MTDITALPLVLTKFRAPTLRPRSVPRTRLTERLTLGARTGLVLVCAPAGYGKSTLLAEWAHSLLKNGTAVAWYALDANDDSPISFTSYLVGSFVQALGPLPELVHAAQLLRSSAEVDLLRIMSHVINTLLLSGRDCVLIVDDYHLIASPAIHSAVAYLLDHLPENLRVALGSRSDPPLPLARLRVRGQLSEIRALDLRFTDDETSQFLKEVMRLELPSAKAAALNARTEGWIAGLQLAALSLSAESGPGKFDSSFSGGHRHLVDYLLDEVVHHQSETVRRFLLSTSALERMCGPLCDAILGETSGGQAILEQLEQANLFVVPLDSRGEWYRYHHLFRDFLQDQLNKTEPERVPPLHRAASAWCAAQGHLREAAQHAFQSGDWDYAAAFVEQHGFTLVVHSEISTLFAWCSVFPAAVMHAHPLLCIHQCWAWVFSFRRKNRGRIEARLQQAEKAIGELKDLQQARELEESVAVVRTYLAMAPDPAANPREQLALAQNALSVYPRGTAGQFSTLLTIGYAHLALQDAQAAYEALEAARHIALREHLYFGVVESTFHLARLAHAQGRLNEAAELCRQGRADIAAILANPERELPALGCLDIALGCVLLEQDHLLEAERELLHGLELLGVGPNPYALMIAYVALYRLCDIQGRPAEALEYLARLEEVWPDVAFCVDGLRVVHALRTAPEEPSTRTQAMAWCGAFSASLGEDAPLPGMGSFGAAEAYYLAYLAWARAQTALGHPQAGRSYLERQLGLAQAQGLTNRVVELSVLEAQAWKAEGDAKNARQALERALVAAQPAGYVRTFDQGAALSRMLVEAAGRDVCRDYVERILTVIGRPTPTEGELGEEMATGSLASYAMFAEPLSERELEVLLLMARGASNRDIAGRLVITVGTVKSHINHILMKLEVHNRTEAVARARELGLLKI